MEVRHEVDLDRDAAMSQAVNRKKSVEARWFPAQPDSRPLTGTSVVSTPDTDCVGHSGGPVTTSCQAPFGLHD